MTGMLDGRAAMITGAASGIGRASSFLFSREGAAVLLGDVDPTGASAVAEEIVAAGGRAHAIELDVSDEASVQHAVDACRSRFGRIDCALNNAGTTGPMAPLHTMESTAWRRTVDVNLSGTFFCMKHQISAMLAQGGGSIVNMASGAAMVPAPMMAAYSATKHGILGLTRSAAQENARTGIRINAICPGSTDTPMLRRSMEVSPAVERMIRSSVPMGRLGEPEEIAEAALWLCSDRASFVTGHSLIADGGALMR